MWWGRYVELSEQAYTTVIKEVERAKADSASAMRAIEDHVVECKDHYRSIDERLGFIQKTAMAIMLSMITFMMLQLWPPITTRGAADHRPVAVERGSANAIPNP